MGGVDVDMGSLFPCGETEIGTSSACDGGLAGDSGKKMVMNKFRLTARSAVYLGCGVGMGSFE
jgi:hypothetical protein